MTVSWQRIRIPLVERLALLDLAERRGQTEEETLSQIIREAVRRECLKSSEDHEEATDRPQEVQGA